MAAALHQSCASIRQKFARIDVAAANFRVCGSRRWRDYRRFSAEQASFRSAVGTRATAEAGQHLGVVDAAISGFDEAEEPEQSEPQRDSGEHRAR
jgi:hypothetical protein